MSDPSSPHDRDEMLARLRRKPRPPAAPRSPKEEEEDAKHAARIAAEMAAIRAGAIPPRASEAELKQAARLLVEQIVKIGEDYLAKNPYRDPSSEHEDDFRELAAATRRNGWRGLIPLFDALASVLEDPTRAVGEHRYRFGFLLRFIEGMLDVARIAGPDAISKILEPQRRGGRTRSQYIKEEADQWRIPALQHAKDLRERWNISQTKLAAEIDGMNLPGTPDRVQIVRTISRCEKAGVLSKPNKQLPKWQNKKR